LIGAAPEEIIFTSGATESINLALKGAAEAAPAGKRHIITAATEHPAVLETVAYLERAAFRVTVLPVDAQGRVSLASLKEAIGQETLLVSLMTANNEIGTIHPVAEIGALCRKHGVLFHTDAAQAAGKVGLDVRAVNVDLVSLSAHKMHGPKGVGALYVRGGEPRLDLACQMHGGGHERGLRAGTLNVAGIVGFGAAAEIALAEMEQDTRRIRLLRDHLERGIADDLEEVTFNGDLDSRLPNNISLTIAGAPADALMMEMKDVAVSTGSACSSDRPEPSRVLRAIGMSPEASRCTIRIGLGRFTTEEEISCARRRIVTAARAVRQRRMALA
jgi:cysteine desulfurase